MSYHILHRAVVCVLLAAGGLVVNAAESQYFYDDLGRLIRIERDDCSAITYSYDDVGNRLNRSVINDQDCDTVRDTLDCAPNDAGAFDEPAEVTAFAIGSDKSTLTWNSAAPTAGIDTVHDVAKGLVGEWPVGTGISESCLATEISAATTEDSATPSSGVGFWYLVRASNVCGVGTYGAETGGAERSTAICP